MRLNPTSPERAQTLICRRIADGTYRPGMSLTIAQVARSCRMGNTAASRALHALAEAGVLERTGSGTAYVPVSPSARHIAP